MNPDTPIPLRSLLVLLIAVVLGSTAHALAADADLKIRAVLVWGTDGEKPAPKPGEKELKDIDAKIGRRLRAVFKWKDYYEVDRKEFVVAAAGSKRVKMSRKCELEVRIVKESTVEVKLYGEKKLVLTRKQVLPPGELLVLAGDDKDNTAWFVLMSQMVKK